MREALKATGRLVALILVLPLAASCWVFRTIGLSDTNLFRMWGQVLALLPGGPGVYLRRAYYSLMLEACSNDCHIGFGTLISHRRVRIESGVYIGNYGLLGHVILREGCMIGSRVSIVSGKNQHRFDGQGKWLPSNLDDFVRIEVGEYAWVGEAAVVMADVGKATAIAAGAVVSHNLPDYVVVAGNPARLVRKLEVATTQDQGEDALP